jgi:hypothetical protein
MMAQEIWQASREEGRKRHDGSTDNGRRGEPGLACQHL